MSGVGIKALRSQSVITEAGRVKILSSSSHHNSTHSSLDLQESDVCSGTRIERCKYCGIYLPISVTLNAKAKPKAFAKAIAKPKVMISVSVSYPDPRVLHPG
jgi:hypothetical protein